MQRVALNYQGNFECLFGTRDPENREPCGWISTFVERHAPA
jgi:hypothetical protein